MKVVGAWLGLLAFAGLGGFVFAVAMTNLNCGAARALYGWEVCQGPWWDRTQRVQNEAP